MAETSAKEIRFEHFVARRHVHLCDRIEQTVTGVIDPHIDTLEMVQGQRQNAVDLFGVTYVAGKRDSAVEKTDSRAC